MAWQSLGTKTATVKVVAQGGTSPSQPTKPTKKAKKPIGPHGVTMKDLLIIGGLIGFGLISRKH